MDIIRYSNILAILSPFFYGIILFFFKMLLININKKFLNLSLIFISLFSFVVFLFDFYFVYFKGLNFSFDLFYLKFSINKTNILNLIFCSFLYFVYAVYLKAYFKKFKHFIFTKQRFLNLFSFLVFNLFLFILSDNLLTSLIFMLLEGVIIYLGAYFDLMKDISNNHISRFLKLLSFSNLSFFLGFLIILKYAYLINLNLVNLKFENLKLIMELAYNLNSVFYLKMLIVTLSIAFFVRFYIFPFASMGAFLSGSSNMLYLSVIFFSSCVFSSCLFLKIIPAFLNIVNYDLTLYFISGITLITSLFFIAFEKDLKIIFAYLISILNAVFMSSYIYFKNYFVLLAYFGLNLLLFCVLAILFYKNKAQFSKRLINKKRGFFLESFYLLIFEKLPYKISKIFGFIDEKIADNIFIFVMKIFDLFIFKFFIKLQKLNALSILKYLILIFIIIILILIIITSGGNYD